jgi:hypothetical protein
MMTQLGAIPAFTDPDSRRFPGSLSRMDVCHERTMIHFHSETTPMRSASVAAVWRGQVLLPPLFALVRRFHTPPFVSPTRRI